MPACLDCLFSSRLLVVLSTCFVFCQVSHFFPDSFSLVVVVSYLLSCLSGFVWQASCCFPTHLSWWPLTTHHCCKIFTWHFSRLPGEFSVSSQTLYLCFPYSFPAAVLPQSSTSLFSFSFIPSLLLLYCFHFDFSCIPTLQPCLLVVFFPTVSHLSLFRFTLLCLLSLLFPPFLPPTPFPRLFLFTSLLIFPAAL